MKNLSPNEQRIFVHAQKRRVDHWRRARPRAAWGTSAKHGALLAACIGGLLAAVPANSALAAAPVYAPALFNDGNAAQRAGRFGPAILDYERARVLTPGDQAIAQNLHAAREKAGITAPSIPAWQRPAQWLSFNALAGLASISLLLFSLLFFGTRFIPATLRGLARGAAMTLGVTMLLAAGAVALRWPELDRAVIIAASPSGARIAPAANAAVTFELKPGEIVSAENRYGAFLRLRTASGQSGWVSASEVEKIIPSAL